MHDSGLGSSFLPIQFTLAKTLWGCGCLGGLLCLSLWRAAGMRCIFVAAGHEFTGAMPAAAGVAPWGARLPPSLRVLRGSGHSSPCMASRRFAG